jgi:hypothetical protein
MTFRELMRGTLRENNELGCVLLVVIVLALIFCYLVIATRYGA